MGKRRSWTAYAAARVMCAAASVPGCVEPKPTGDRPMNGAAPSGGRSPFEPVSVRVHPLTRLLADATTGRRRIEVHMELIDRWNHGVKALGTVVVELYQTGGPAARDRGGPMQLRLWTIDLTDPDANSRPYDRVTHTYRLVLEGAPEDLPPAEELELHVRFSTRSGALLTTTRRLGGM